MLQFNTEDKQTTHAPSNRDNGANIEGDTRAIMAGDCETITRNMFVRWITFHYLVQSSALRCIHVDKWLIDAELT